MNCADKFLKHSERVGARFAEQNAGTQQVRRLFRTDDEALGRSDGCCSTKIERTSIYACIYLVPLNVSLHAEYPASSSETVMRADVCPVASGLLQSLLLPHETTSLVTLNFPCIYGYTRSDEGSDILALVSCSPNSDHVRQTGNTKCPGWIRNLLRRLDD